MRFGSVCSGIEAASVAWHPLGWRAQFVSEIEPFPCAVLAHHYPIVPNHGDMTKFKEWPDADIDVLVGGTPCQSFSVAGLRAGLDDPRGNLMLTFGAVAARYRPEWIVWENVPGVLSSNGGRDFGSFLGLLGQLGYGFAYRVLDAQFVRVDGLERAVPQRRRRVFVVGCLGDWRRAAAVLLERQSLSGHPAPRRSSGARVAATLTRGAESSGKGGYAGRRQEDDVNIVAGALTGNGPGAGWRIGPDEAAAHHCIAIQGSMLGRAVTAGPAGSGISESGESFTLTKTDVHAVAYDPAISPALKACDYKGPSSDGDGAILAPMVSHALRSEGFDASEDGTGRGTPLVPIAQIVRGNQGSGGNLAGLGMDEPHQTLTKQDHGNAIAFYTTKITSACNYSKPQAGGPCHPLAAGAHAPAIASRTQVRRLTPRECARLQGFPDDYLDITFRGKPASDAVKYKALGNSMAVNCMRWIGTRIQMVEAIEKARAAA